MQSLLSTSRPSDSRQLARRFMLAAICSIMAVALASCGGSHTNEGIDNTNTRVEISVRPGQHTINLCTDGYAPAIANITVTKLRHDLPDNTIYLDTYSIGYIPTQSSLANAPLMEGGAHPIFQQAFPSDGRLRELQLDLVLPQAISLVNSAIDAEGGGGAYIGYSVLYSFAAHDEFGNTFMLHAGTGLALMRSSSCAADDMPALLLSPSAITLASLANPDADARDDVAFAITGGAGPYTVYSSNGTAIASPGALANGVAAFTIDPDAVAAQTEVLLTVLDSSEPVQSAYALIGLAP